MSYGLCSPSILGLIHLTYCNKYLQSLPHLTCQAPELQKHGIPRAIPGQSVAKETSSVVLPPSYCRGGDYCCNLQVASPGCRWQFLVLARHSEGNRSPPVSHGASGLIQRTSDLPPSEKARQGLRNQPAAAEDLPPALRSLPRHPPLQGAA